jgi:formylglycine-generating enzyme required for sulfatase activity
MKIDYALHGDFVFLSPRGVGGDEVIASEDAIVKQRQAQMLPGRFVDCSDCPVMVEIPGSEKTGGFALARTETTFEEWDACFHDLACRRYLDDDGLGRGDRPAAGTTWLDQRDFIAWLNRRNKRKDTPCAEYRLPTAEEWKFAALAGSSTRFSWGEEMLPAHAICLGCDEALDGSAAYRTAAFGANRLGLYDMTGNVWEWVDDRDCPDSEFSEKGACAAPGTVMGGAFSTSVNSISALAEGKLPRTGNELGSMYSLPTVGFRAACTLKTR